MSGSTTARVLGRAVLVLVAAVPAALSVACGRSPERPATAPPTATAGLHPTPPPPAVLSGEVTETIQAVTSNDLERVFARFGFTRVVCADDAWPLPVCGPGQAEGSETQRVPFVSCEPAFLDGDELRFVLAQVLIDRSAELYAIVESGTGTEGDLFPLGPTAVVFSTVSPGGSSASSGLLMILNEQGRVVSLRTGCRATPADLLATAVAGS